MSNEYESGVGIDIGTSYIQVARQKRSDTGNGEVVFTTQRDAFFERRPMTKMQAVKIKEAFDKRRYYYVKRENEGPFGTYYLVGQTAIDYASEIGETVLRPLRQGVLSPKNRDAFGMLSVIVSDLLGKPLYDHEVCCFSCPAPPVAPADADFDTTYHEDLLKKIITHLGYRAFSILEAEAVMYSELIQDDYTGISTSWGAGMTNVCVSHVGEILLSFSVARGGDWIDNRVATALGHPETLMQVEKESGIDLLNPRGEVQICYASYYDRLISLVVDTLYTQLQQLAERSLVFKRPVPLVVSGGTSLAGGFLTRLSQICAARGFPFQIREVIQAEDPLRAVANGCLIAALAS